MQRKSYHNTDYLSPGYILQAYNYLGAYEFNKLTSGLERGELYTLTMNEAFKYRIDGRDMITQRRRLPSIDSSTIRLSQAEARELRFKKWEVEEQKRKDKILEDAREEAEIINDMLIRKKKKEIVKRKLEFKKLLEEAEIQAKKEAELDSLRKGVPIHPFELSIIEKYAFVYRNLSIRTEVNPDWYNIFWIILDTDNFDGLVSAENNIKFSLIFHKSYHFKREEQVELAKFKQELFEGKPYRDCSKKYTGYNNWNIIPIWIKRDYNMTVMDAFNGKPFDIKEFHFI
jgi:hypothetical protein